MRTMHIPYARYIQHHIQTICGTNESVSCSLLLMCLVGYLTLMAVSWVGSQHGLIGWWL